MSEFMLNVPTIAERLGYSPITANANLERFMDFENDFSFNILSPDGVKIFPKENDADSDLHTMVAYDFILSDSIEYANDLVYSQEGITFYLDEGQVFAPWTSLAFKEC